MIGRRGEIWWVSLDPAKGREQRSTRPAVVVSVPALTKAIGMAWVTPLTSTNRGWQFHVAVPQTPQTGLRGSSHAMIEQTRSVHAASRFGAKLGELPQDVLEEIDNKIRLVLGWPLHHS